MKSFSLFTLTRLAWIITTGVFTSTLAHADTNENNPDKICRWDKKKKPCEGDGGGSDDSSKAGQEFQVAHDKDCPEGSTLVRLDNQDRRTTFLKRNKFPENVQLATAFLSPVTNAPLGGFSPGFISPASFQAYGSDAEVVRDANAYIRQVRGSKGLLDITFPETKTALIRYYLLKDVGTRKVNGVYPINNDATPLKSFRYVENQAGNTVSREFIDNRAAHSSIQNMEMTQQLTDDPYTIILTKTYKKGEGISAMPYRRVTTKITSIPNGEPGEEKYLSSTEEIGSDGEWYLMERKSGRRALYKEEDGLVPLYECDAVDAEGNPLPRISTETTFTYYTDYENSPSFGKIKTLRRNDGYWENKYYEANPHAGIETEKTESPWLNTSAHEPGSAPSGSIRTRTEVRCSTDNGTEDITVTVDGKLLEKEWTGKSPVGQDKVKEVRHQPHSGGDKITTTIRYRRAADIPAHLKGRPISIQYADGECELYTYELSNNLLTTTHDRGHGTNGAITQGIRTITVKDYPNENLQSEVRYALEGGQAHRLSSKTGVEFDNSGYCLKWIYNNNPEDYSALRKDCCQVTWRRDRDGTETTYTHDGADRITAQTTKGITYTTEYKGLTSIQWRQLSGQSDRYLVSKTTKNLAGQTIQTATPAFGGGELTSSAEYNIVDRTTTTLSPTGLTTSEQRFADDQIQSSTGATGITQSYAYSPAPNGTGGTNTTVTCPKGQTTQTIDLLDNELLLISPSGARHENHYNAAGDLIRSVNPDNEVTLYSREEQAHITCLDYNRNGSIDLDQDTATRVSTTFDPSWPENQGSWKTVTEKAWQGQWISVQSSWNTEDGTASRTQTKGVAGFQTTITTPVYQQQGTYTTVITEPEGQQTFIEYTRERNILTGTTATWKDKQGQILNSQQSTFNAWGATLTQTDSRTGTTTYTYNEETGLLLRVATPAQHTTSYQYDAHGRRIGTLLPDGSQQYVEYDALGQIVKQWGSQQYPVKYEYDAYGRQTAMWTYRTPVGSTASWPDSAVGDKTTWIYDQATSQLSRKLYADGNGPAYTYTPDGKRKTETNARGTVISRDYDSIGRLIRLSANDKGVTPAQTYAYNQLGNVTEAVTEGVAEYRYEYSGDHFRLVQEHITLPYEGGTLTRQIRRAYDQYARPAGYTLNNGSVTEQRLVYTYNNAGKIGSITADGKSFQYTYVPRNPRLITGVSSPVHTVTNTWEANRDILLAKSNHWKNKPDNSLISSYTYTVNALEQRTSVATAGEAFKGTSADWQWSYDALGQVIQANTDGYSYDQIGNRLQTTKNSQTVDTYTANALNQYTEITGTPAQYDADGNLLSGLQPTEAQPDRNQLVFTYNAHNRPVIVGRGSTALENYTYDHRGRRIQKGGTTNSLTLYDGYNAIAEYKAASIPVMKKAYAWGLDILGRLTQSGGVGALLCVTDYQTQQPLVSYPAYDGNGNITQYVTEASNGTLTAHYEYDAFGNLKKKENTKEYCYQFSTKPFDLISGLIYYNYRNYDFSMNQWTTRDPIKEEGGMNLYKLNNNDSVNNYDFLGLAIAKCCDKEGIKHNYETTKSCCNKKGEIINKKDCTTVIYVGHYSSLPQKDHKPGPEDRSVFVTCKRKDKNSEMSAEGFSCVPDHGKKRTNCFIFPNNSDCSYKNHADYKRDRGDTTVEEAFKYELKNAEKEAKEQCKSKDYCCKRVLIKVFPLDTLPENPEPGASSGDSWMVWKNYKRGQIIKTIKCN